MSQPITSIYLAKRNPELERHEYPARWRRHGTLALSLPFMDPCVGYFHNDVDAAPPADADPYTTDLWSAEYDGVGIVMFAGPEDLEDLLTHPTFPILLADEWGAFNEPVANFALMTHERVHKLHRGTAAQFFLFLRAADGVDAATFAERWLAHVSTVMRSPELASLVLTYTQYTQMATGDAADDDPALRERIEIGLAGITGVARVGFASRADMETYLGHPDRAAVLEDLASFADVGEGIMVATNEVTMKTPAWLR